MGRDFLVDAARIGMCIRIIGGCGLGESVAGNRARVVDRAGGLAVARGILTDAVSARFCVGVRAGICVSDARGDDFAAIVGEGGAGKFVVVCGSFLVDANRDTGAMGVCGGRRGRALGKGIDAFIIGATGVRQADGRSAGLIGQRTLVDARRMGLGIGRGTIMGHCIGGGRGEDLAAVGQDRRGVAEGSGNAVLFHALGQGVGVDIGVT